MCNLGQESDHFTALLSAREQTGPRKRVSVLNEDRAELEKVVNDKARRVKIRGNHVIVPLKFDEDGNPATQDKLIFKRLSLNDLRFLAVWRDSSWDISKAKEKTSLSDSQVERLVKKLQVFREEDARVKALCEIPTPSWIAAKHVQNVYEGGTLEDSSHKSLQELAKIEGAYKQQAPQTQINVFNLPSLPTDQEARLKEVFDTIALDQGEQNVA